MEQQKKKYVYSLVDAFEGPEGWVSFDENGIMRGTLEECREKMPNADQLKREIQIEESGRKCGNRHEYLMWQQKTYVYKIYKIGIDINEGGEEEEDVDSIEEVERIQMTVEEAFKHDCEEEEEEEEE